MYKAPNHGFVLKKPPACVQCGASRLRDLELSRLEYSRIALLFSGLGQRRLPLALGLFIAQRYEKSDAR